MRIDTENFQSGWSNVYIGLKPNDIDRLIALLKTLKEQQEQHFHLSSSYEGDGGVADIEFHIQAEQEDDNMTIFGLAIPPSH